MTVAAPCQWNCPAHRSDDPSYSYGLHTLRVADLRPWSGDTAAAPRRVRALPFHDSGDTRSFTNNYAATTDPDVGPGHDHCNTRGANQLAADRGVTQSSPLASACGR